MTSPSLRRLNAVARRLFWGGILLYLPMAMLLWNPPDRDEASPAAIDARHAEMALDRLQLRLNRLEETIRAVTAGRPDPTIRRQGPLLCTDPSLIPVPNCIDMMGPFNEEGSPQPEATTTLLMQNP